MLRNIVLLLAMLAAASGGYFLGARSGREARDTLARVEQAARQADADAARTRAALDTRLAGLSRDYETQLERLRGDRDRQLGALNAALAGRDQRIADLAAASGKTRQQIDQLRADLASAGNDSTAQALRDKIAGLEAELQANRTRALGLECSSVPVPRELLAPLTGAGS